MHSKYESIRPCPDIINKFLLPGSLVYIVWVFAVLHCRGIFWVIPGNLTPNFNLSCMREILGAAANPVVISLIYQCNCFASLVIVVSYYIVPCLCIFSLLANYPYLSFCFVLLGRQNCLPIPAASDILMKLQWSNKERSNGHYWWRF